MFLQTRKDPESVPWLTRVRTAARRRLLLLGLVDEGAAFAEVEVHLVPAVAALQLQQRRVLALVPQTALVAGEDGLTPESEGSKVNISTCLQT